MQLPVRRRSHPSPAKTLETIRREVETYALVFPEVAFTLQNTNSKFEQGATVSRIPKVCTAVVIRTLRTLIRVV